MFQGLGISQRDAEKLAVKVKSGYSLIRNPTTIKVGEGSQYFGSGGYCHSYKIWVPTGAGLREVGSLLDLESYDNGFVSGTWYTIKPTKAPLVISHSRGDKIGHGPRWFNREVFVVLPGK